jgi:hypothetical protein
MTLAIRLFRFVALLGSLINFFLQNNAINSARCANLSLIKIKSHRALHEVFPCAAEADHEEGLKFNKKAEFLDFINVVLNRVLIGCTVLFLVLAFWLTWGVISPETK